MAKAFELIIFSQVMLGVYAGTWDNRCSPKATLRFSHGRKGLSPAYPAPLAKTGSRGAKGLLVTANLSPLAFLDVTRPPLREGVLKIHFAWKHK